SRTGPRGPARPRPAGRHSSCAGRERRWPASRRLSRQDRAELAIELGRGQGADLARPDDAVTPDEVGLRWRHGLPGGRPATVAVDHRAPRGAVARRELARRLVVVVLPLDPDDLEAIPGHRLGRGDEQRELLATWDAPRGPEVDDDRPSAQRGEIEGPAVEGRPGQSRGRIAGFGRSTRRSARATADPDHGDQERQDRGAGQRAGRMRRDGVPYWAV